MERAKGGKGCKETRNPHRWKAAFLVAREVSFRQKFFLGLAFVDHLKWALGPLPIWARGAKRGTSA